MENEINNKINLYQRTVIFSILFTLIGFSYNVWRMEVSENNNNIRTASFEVLKNLSALEQLTYAAYYDKNTIEGNPRKGWITVGLIDDMSVLTNDKVNMKATTLSSVWANNWQAMSSQQQAADNIVAAIDSVRVEIKHLLKSLD